ncbi:lymphocyte antigen 6B-like [Glandiceps talaboti]
MLKWTVMLFVLVALSIDNAASIECYSCSDYLFIFGGECENPDTTTDTDTNCTTTCLRTLTYVASKVPTAYTRGCGGGNCQESDNIVEALGIKTGAKTTCCDSELCNGGTTPTIGAVVIMLSAILTAVWITQ